MLLELPELNWTYLIPSHCNKIHIVAIFNEFRKLFQQSFNYFKSDPRNQERKNRRRNFNNILNENVILKMYKTRKSSELSF